MDKRTTFRVSLVAAALASAGGIAGAQGILSDNRGAPVASDRGECVRSQSTTGRVECGPGVMPGAEVSAFEAQPARSAAATAPMTTAAAPGAVIVETIPAERGFVIDDRGNVVRSDRGDCVVPDTGAAPIGVPQCGGIVVAEPVLPPVEAAPPQAEVAPAPAQPRTIPLRRVTLDADTTFNFDSAELTDEGKEQLNDIVEAGAEEDLARLRIHITGYADRIGPETYNLSLSEERANTVREYLVAEGLPEDVITFEGRGESNPVVQCEGMAGVALIECLRPNRRTEVEFAALVPSEEEAAQSQPAPNAPSAEPPAVRQGPWSPGTDTGTPR